MYEVAVSEKVLKKLKDIPQEYRIQFYEKAEIISENPFADIPFVKRLTNSTNFRFRFGQYRCVYNVETEKQTITIIDVDHRKNIYRRKK